MADKYIINKDRLYTSEMWLEATADEVRILAAILAYGGEVGSVESIADGCGIKPARVKTTINMWLSTGVIKKDAGESKTPHITYEHEQTHERGVVDEARSVDVAARIRDEGLGELIEDVGTLLSRSSFSPQETKYICYPYTELGLDKHYIITLATYLADKGRLTPKRLSDDSSRLVERGIDNIELLEKYIEDANSYSSIEWEIRRLCRIYDRGLSKSEVAHIKRWTGEYGYDMEVIGEAYDIMIMSINKVSFQYMNKLLTKWHEAGLKTPEEIATFREREQMTKRGAGTEKKGKAPDAPVTPKYSDYTAEEAMMRALERSYGEGK